MGPTSVSRCRPFHPLSLSISLFVSFSPSIWPPKGKSPMRRFFIQQLLEEVVFPEPRVWRQPVSTAKGGQRLTEVKSSHKRAVSYWPLRASEQGAGLLWPTANSQARQSKSRSRNRATKEAAVWQRYTIRPTGWQLRKGLWPSPSLLLMVCGLFSWVVDAMLLILVSPIEERAEESGNRETPMGW